MPRLSRTEWRKTPYAKSEASNPEGAIQQLLARYRVKNIQMTQCAGPNRRPAFMLRFVLRDKTYRIGLETLDVADVKEHELLLQIKRAVYYFVKSQLEIATVFWTPEEALFAFLELPQGGTLYEIAKPQMERLTSGADFAAVLLPKPAEDPE